MDDLIENMYIYENNNNLLTYRKSSDAKDQNELPKLNENIKINKDTQNICDCEKDDALHICCGIIISAIFFSFVKIF